MKIHLLFFSKVGAEPKSIEMMKESAEKLGHELKIIYASQCQLDFTGKPKVLVDNKVPKDIKILFIKSNFRGATLDNHVGLIKQFELSGVKVINNHLGVMRAKNKIRSIQILKKYKIPSPKTYVVRSSEYIGQMVKNINSFPVILKSVTGSQGIGVLIVESQRGLRSIIELLVNNENQAPVIIQQYIKESSGKDVRIFIVGNKIVAAMERIAVKKGEFRSNFSLGGKVKIAELTDEEKKMAIKAAKAFDLEVAGVDLIRTKNGPQILEVNSNPGLEGITQATGIDIAGKIIKYAVKKAKSKTS
jgi:ribosomal protein S6--L-glutamate ligase